MKKGRFLATVLVLLSCVMAGVGELVLIDNDAVNTQDGLVLMTIMLVQPVVLLVVFIGLMAMLDTKDLVYRNAQNKPWKS